MRSSTNKIAPNLETVLGRAHLMKLTSMFLFGAENESGQIASDQQLP